MGDDYAGTGIDLNLTNPNTRNGKVYYYLDQDFANLGDRVTHTELDNLLNGGADTINTQPGGHDGSDDERSVIIDGYALVLPTVTEIQAFLAAGNEPLGGWQDRLPYWAAGLAIDDADNTRMNVHERVLFYFVDTSDSRHGQIFQTEDSNSRTYAFFQVLTAQRTISVILPADQLSMRTTTVEVATIDTTDSITDGLLIAELMAVTGSLIEFDSTVSEVAIQHNNSMVTITGPGGLSPVIVDENSSATLVINVTPPLPDDRALNVNLSYTDVISGTTEMRTITVPAGSMSYEFPFSVGDDEIAAQTTRTFNVSLAPGGYDRGSPSSVEINVLNDDLAEVSISAVNDPVDEGAFAQFEVQVDKEIAVSLTVAIGLITTREGSEISRSSTDVVITADKTTALLTVDAMDDIAEVDSFLTASIDSLPLPESISGVKPTISTDNSSATVTILDNDAPLSITAEPASVDLAVGDSAQINVSVNRIEGNTPVTINIDATGGLSVPSSLTLATRDEVGVATITAIHNPGTQQNVRFMATSYTATIVQVNITTPPPPGRIKCNAISIGDCHRGEHAINDYSESDHGHDNDQCGRRRGQYNQCC